MQRKTVIPGVNDGTATHPEAAALMVDKSLCTELTGSSNKKVEFWCGGPRTTTGAHPLSNVARQGTRCPQSFGRRPSLAGDLAATHPDLAAQLVDQSLATTLKSGSDMSVILALLQIPILTRERTWHRIATLTKEDRLPILFRQNQASSNTGSTRSITRVRPDGSNTLDAAEYTEGN